MKEEGIRIEFEYIIEQTYANMYFNNLQRCPKSDANHKNRLNFLFSLVKKLQANHLGRCSNPFGNLNHHSSVAM